MFSSSGEKRLLLKNENWSLQWIVIKKSVGELQYKEIVEWPFLKEFVMEGRKQGTEEEERAWSKVVGRNMKGIKGRILWILDHEEKLSLERKDETLFAKIPWLDTWNFCGEAFRGQE